MLVHRKKWVEEVIAQNDRVMEAPQFNVAACIDVFTKLREYFAQCPTEARRYKIVLDLIYDLGTHRMQPQVQGPGSGALKASADAWDFARQMAIMVFWPLTPDPKSGVGTP